MQKDSIEALHQNQNPLVQEAGPSSLARVFRNPPSKIIEEVTSRSVKKRPGLYRNWLKDVTSTIIIIIIKCNLYSALSLQIHNALHALCMYCIWNKAREHEQRELFSEMKPKYMICIVRFITIGPNTDK